jgi:hypothetical protein
VLKQLYHFTFTKNKYCVYEGIPMLKHHIMQVYGEVEILLEIFLILAATTSAVTEKSLSLLGIKSQPITCHCHSINNAHLLVYFDVPSLESMKTGKVTGNAYWA